MEGFVQSIATMETGDFIQVVLLLAVGTAVGFWLWRRSLTNARVIEDVATSLVRSAAQGYVELCGSQFPCEDRALSAPLSGRSCTWWSYKIEKKKTYTDSKGRRKTKWVTVESKTSPHLIRFEDDTGDVLVNPEGAQVVPVVRNTWYGHTRRPTGGPPSGGGGFLRLVASGRYRYTEELMRPGASMYAIGHFETRTGELGGSEVERQKRDLLAEWKQDREALVERFDADGDGTVDMEEWEAAREEAERVMRRRVAESAAEPAVNLMLKPPDGRPFILSPKSQEELAKHFRGQSVLWVVLFLVCGALLGTALTVRFGGG